MAIGSFEGTASARPKVSVTFDPDVFEFLNDEAKRRKISFSEMVRIASRFAYDEFNSARAD
jgi:hypothetical protein